MLYCVVITWGTLMAEKEGTGLGLGERDELVGGALAALWRWRWTPVSLRSSGTEMEVEREGGGGRCGGGEESEV